MSKEKIFISSLTPSEKFGNSILNGSVVIQELIDLLNSDKVQKLAYDYKGKKRVNIQIIEWRKEDRHGRTHSLEVNTFVPDRSKADEADNDNQNPANDNAETSEETSTENQASSDAQADNKTPETESSKGTSDENSSDSEKNIFEKKNEKLKASSQENKDQKKTGSSTKRGSKTRAKKPVTA